MEITFLLGNGFDLRLGMKTRFIDMYEGYTAQKSSSDAVKKFKDLLKSDWPKYKNWGDFEIAMAQNAKRFDDEASFIECLRDFKIYMSTHLESEQWKFKRRLNATSATMEKCGMEMLKSIQNFFKGLTPNVVNEFSKLRAQSHVSYSVISFNYTNVFDELWCQASRNFTTDDIIHIHGRLDADVVLGADSLEQVGELPYPVTAKFERAFIKPKFNQQYDMARVARAETLIANSRIICIYGMSLGKSDYSWIVKLKNWLLANKSNHLVYFTHSNDTFNKLNWDAIIDEEEERIVSLLGTLCDSDEEMNRIFNQVHIPVGYDIFDFNRIIQDEELERVIKDDAKRDKKSTLSEATFPQSKALVR